MTCYQNEEGYVMLYKISDFISTNTWKYIYYARFELYINYACTIQEKNITTAN